MTTGNPLWSERQGKQQRLSTQAFDALVKSAVGKAIEEGLFVWAFHLDESGAYYDKDEATEFFSLHLGAPWPADALEYSSFFSYQPRDEVLDFLELSARELVSTKSSNDDERALGRARFAGLVNPLLSRLDPPLEMRDDGTIVQRLDASMSRLVDQPLPSSAPEQEVKHRITDAIEHYRRRGATLGDRRAAVRELADVLEYLRPQVKDSMLTADERDLFNIANNFTVRHNKPETKRNWEDPAWLAWLFYLYLATVRLVLELSARDADSR